MLENNWIDPFNSDKQELICISTGKAAPSDIEDDLINAKMIGEQAYKEFSKQRIESSPEKLFHDTLSKQQLKTFTSMEKKKMVRNKEKRNPESRQKV